MRDFWDRRAEEDAFYFVDNRLAYGAPDLDAFWAGGREDLDQILDQLGVAVEPADEVVEIGCGVGRITRELAARAATVRALDVSGRMLDLAREHNPQADNVTWIQGEGTTLSGVADASADACFSHVVFQHIPDPQITLGYVREMGRVLRTGGWAAFQISNTPAIHRRRPWRERARSLPRRILGRGPRGQAHEAWLGSAVDLEELRQVAEGSGMSLQRVTGEGTQWCLVLLRRLPDPPT
jgi:SAM-dependent methyltransferase